MCGTEKLHVTVQDFRDLPKANVFSAMSKTKVHGPFSVEATVSSTTYLDMLEQWIVAPVNDSLGKFRLQENWALPNFQMVLRDFLPPM
jgi:hypothetical protein